MTSPRPLRRHVFQPGRWKDHRDVPICLCGSTQDASIHKLPERDSDEREHEARKVGDR